MAEKEAAKRIFDPVGDVAGALANLTPGHGSHAGRHGEWYNNLDVFLDEMGEFGVSRALLIWLMYVLLAFLGILQMPTVVYLTITWLILLMPVWLPICLAITIVRVWWWYVTALFIGSRKPVLLELKFPRDILKSPRAMETALAAFWVVTGETTFIDRWWDGKVRTWFSLEMAVFDGELHFYIWCWKEFRSLVESQIYAQYPELEIVEAEDYSTKFVYDPKEYDLFANDMLFTKGPGATAMAGNEAPYAGIYPIRSYIDFELDKDPKEEYKVDPLAQMVERFSNLEKSEQGWAQIIIRSLWDKGDIKDMAQKEVEKIRLAASLRPRDPDHPTPEEELTMSFPHPTWKQQEQIRAIERHLGKRIFETGIRICYIAKYEDYSAPNRNSIRWLFVPYNSDYLNILRPRRWHGPFDYPWQDFHGIRWRLTARRFLDAYRRRSYFHAPWISPIMIMSAESLASMFHPPSRTIASPGLHRIAATKSAPPPNLPK